MHQLHFDFTGIWEDYYKIAKKYRLTSLSIASFSRRWLANNLPVLIDSTEAFIKKNKDVLVRQLEKIPCVKTTTYYFCQQKFEYKKLPVKARVIKFEPNQTVIFRGNFTTY